MNCQNAQNCLSSYLDRELTGDQMLAVRDHLSHCDGCQSELDSLRVLKRDLAGLPMVSPSESFVPRIMEAVGAVEPEEPDRRAYGAIIATSVAAAVLAFVLFNAFFSPTDQTAGAQPGFDAASDSALTTPDLGGHAPLIPVGR